MEQESWLTCKLSNKSKNIDYDDDELHQKNSISVEGILPYVCNLTSPEALLDVIKQLVRPDATEDWSVTVPGFLQRLMMKNVDLIYNRKELGGERSEEM